MKNKYYVLICDGEIKIINVPQNVNLYFVLKEFNASRAVACESLKRAKIIKKNSQTVTIPKSVVAFLFILKCSCNLLKT